MKGYVFFAASAIGMVGGMSATGGQTEVTYGNRIRLIVRDKCLECHRAKGSAPFDFSTYEGVKAKAELIRTQVLSHNMPPIWVHSDYGKLAVVSPVDDREAIDLQVWIGKGMPRGAVSSDSDRPSNLRGSKVLTIKPKSKLRTEGPPYWLVQTIELPRQGGEFNGFQILPSTPRASASALVAIVPKSMKMPRETAGSLDLSAKYLVGAWAPGYRPWALPAGMTYKYPPNSKLVVQTLHKPTGKPENLEFQVELIGTQLKKSSSPRWISVEKKPLVIPAGKSPSFDLDVPIEKDIDLISILPEARFYAGKVELLYRDVAGNQKTVFENIRWDPFWVGNNMFEKPLRLAKGGRLTARFYYNNDDKCRMNEGKVIHDIKNGPTASDELCRLHLLVGP